MHTREETLATVRQRAQWPVLIIGAGINGLGTFLDLALQGVDVLIVDQGDFCSGASAASSHMVHGGVRYLENGEFRLVREAVQERNRLLQNAPHYVHPLPTTFPIYKWASGLFNAPMKFLGLLDRPSERGAMVIKTGLTLYDVYAGGTSNVPKHEFHSRAESLQRYPQLNPDIVCTATYYDAAMWSPERICIEIMLDAEAAHPGAHALNYVSAIGTEGPLVCLRDELSGDVLRVQPQLVINAAGPWIDLTNDALGTETRFIGGTKGSHLVLDHPALRAAIGEHEFFFENKDGRIVLIYPLKDKVLVGTSDIPITDPNDARCTDEEIDYFIELVSYVFPTIKVTRDHIVFRFSGVRPLPASEANSAGQISRDHHNHITEPNEKLQFPTFNLVGGKWTTFRAFAEQVSDAALQRLNKTRRANTKDLPIGGGKDYPQTEETRQRWLENLARQNELSLEQATTLFERYGTRASAVAQFISADSDAPLQYLPEYSRREVQFLAQEEKVVHVEDLLLRRSLIGMLGQTSGPLVQELAVVLGESLGWSAERQQAEIERTAARFADYYAVHLTV